MSDEKKTCKHRGRKIFLGLGVVALIAGVTFAVTSHASQKEYGWGHGMSGGMSGGMSNFMGHGMRSGDNHMAEMFEIMDTDRDGKITAQEMEAVRMEKFSEADSNGNNQIDMSEFEGMWMGRIRDQILSAFQNHDENNDGAISQDEMAKPMSSMVYWLDKNNDGVIEKSEMPGRHGKYGMGKRYHHDDDDDDD
jgi:Ca2+-binding EF-hand superfamily protein